MLKRKPANEYRQILCISEYEPKRNIIKNDNLNRAITCIISKRSFDIKMLVKRQFERTYNAIETMSCSKYEDTPENKEIFSTGSKIIIQMKWIILY